MSAETGEQCVAAPAAAFPVWVEIRCTVCTGQIAGAFAQHAIPHQTLEGAARTTGAVRVEDRWLCRGCARQISEKKRIGIDAFRLKG